MIPNKKCNERDLMPQVDEADIPELIQFIRDRGIYVAFKSVYPVELRLSNPVDMKKVMHLTPELRVKKVIASCDGGIIDGNHRRAGHCLDGTLVPIIEIGATFQKAVEMICEFPKVYYYGDGKDHQAERN